MLYLLVTVVFSVTGIPNVNIPILEGHVCICIMHAIAYAHMQGACMSYTFKGITDVTETDVSP